MICRQDKSIYLLYFNMKLSTSLAKMIKLFLFFGLIELLILLVTDLDIKTKNTFMPVIIKIKIQFKQLLLGSYKKNIKASIFRHLISDQVMGLLDILFDTKQTEYKTRCQSNVQ